MKHLMLVTIVAVTACSTKNEKPMNSIIQVPADSSHLAFVRANAQSMYTVFVTSDLTRTRDFYVNWFAFQPVFESTWFVVLQIPGSSGNLIAFIDEVHPSIPPSPKAISGEGAFLTIDVADAEVLFNAFRKSNAEFAYDLKQEPWGQKRFAITDPNGIWIDVVQQVEPQAGWWDQYMGK